MDKVFVGGGYHCMDRRGGWFWNAWAIQTEEQGDSEGNQNGLSQLLECNYLNISAFPE